MATFSDLGIPCPLFEAPTTEASDDTGLATCRICGGKDRHCFELGIGDALILPCPACGTENGLRPTTGPTALPLLRLTGPLPGTAQGQEAVARLLRLPPSRQLVLAGAVSAWQAVRATLAKRGALAERDRAEQEKDRAETSFRMARETVDRFFTEVGESPKLKAQGMEKFRKDLLQNAKEFYERFIRERPDAPEVRQDLGLAYVRLAKIHQALGDFAGAQTLSEKAVAILSELARAQPDVADYQRDLAASHFELGDVYLGVGRFDEADAAYQQARAIQTKLAADHPELAEYPRALATTQNALGRLGVRAGQYDKAHESLEKALAIWSQLVRNHVHVPEDRHGLASAQLTLGTAYGATGQSEKSKAMLKEAASTYQALVADYPDVP
jgi:tetratricopeptide (TPR) repeat protein